VCKITLTEEDLKPCEEFAKEMEKYNYSYLKRTGNENGFYGRQFTGKVCEVAVRKYLTTKYPDKIIPAVDFSIQSNKQRSFAPDFIVEGHNIHVKGQSVSGAGKYGLSWLINKKDAELITGMVYLCIYDNRYIVEIVEKIKAEDLKPLLKEPVAEHLKKSKFAIYGADLGIELEDK
jgi:hypothetical protein